MIEIDQRPTPCGVRCLDRGFDLLDESHGSICHSECLEHRDGVGDDPAAAVRTQCDARTHAVDQIKPIPDLVGLCYCPCCLLSARGEEGQGPRLTVDL